MAALDPSPCTPPYQHQSQGTARGRRAAPRLRLALPGQLITFAGNYSCCVLDVSTTGAQVACEYLPKPGRMAVVEVEGIEFFGTVKWSAGRCIGIALDEELAEDLILKLRQTVDSYGERQRRQLRSAARDFVEGRAEVLGFG